MQGISSIQSLTIDDVEQLVVTFRSMAVHFPIWIFPGGVSCIDYIEQKPFVMLAMLVASSLANERLHISQCVGEKSDR
jgi:hypothetical protein